MYSTLLVKTELVVPHISFEVKNCILNFLFSALPSAGIYCIHLHTYSSDVLLFNIFCDNFEQNP